MGHHLAAHQGTDAVTHAALVLTEGSILLHDIADNVVLRHGKNGTHSHEEERDKQEYFLRAHTCVCTLFIYNGCKGSKKLGVKS